MSAEAVPLGAARPHDAAVDEARVEIRKRKKKKHIVAQTTLAAQKISNPQREYHNRENR